MPKQTALLCLLSCSLIPMALADPFNKGQREVDIASPAPSIRATSPSCQQEGQVFFDDVPFQSLTLVGLLKQAKGWQAFFINKQQEMVLVQKGDWLAQEKMEITLINQHEVQLLKRENPQHCQQTQRVILTL
ncbi:pilus assembly protein PilP [Pasteurella sp. PK-2025]|uniref:pilus assembly protein PilP n=1 Tax=Pasteurella sp. PK-2025 TaxID=3413133 RepID=UPI003C710C52